LKGNALRGGLRQDLARRVRVDDPVKDGREAEIRSLAGVKAPDQLVRALHAMGRQVRARRGQTIVAADAPTDDVYVVRSGLLRAELLAVSGREVIMRDLYPGQMFGELSAIDGGRRSTSIAAVSDSSLLIVPGQAFRAAGAADPETALWLHQHLVAIIRNLTDRVFELSAIHVQGRIHCQLLRMAASVGVRKNQAVIERAPTHEALAALSGTHREAVSREMSALARAGLVRQQGRRLEIIDVVKLSLLVQQATGFDFRGGREPPGRIWRETGAS
jgi:CRP/FNR family cyclic AMP-dependent transcriptional regulator